MRSWGIGTSERQEEESLQPPQGMKGLQESSPEQGPPLARCCGRRKTWAGVRPWGRPP